jgi:hypothetical protein
VGSRPNSADQFWNADGPEAFIRVAGPGGTYTPPFGGTGNKALVIDNPGQAQPIVVWRSMFSDDPALFQDGSFEFDLYLPLPGSRDWTYFDFRVGYGGSARVAPTTVNDTTIWNSFRINPGTIPDIVLDDGTGTGIATIQHSTVLHLRYDLNEVAKTYRLTINGTVITFGANPDRPWRAGATGANMFAFYGAFPNNSAPVYVDNIVVTNDSCSVTPWAPPAIEPTNTMEWYQHRGNKRLTGEATFHQDIVTGSEVLWSEFVGSREAWMAVAPQAGSQVLPVPPQTISMSASERQSWGIGAPYFDLSGNGTLTAESTSSARRIGDFIPNNGRVEKLEVEVFDTTFGQGVVRLSTYQNGAWVQQWQSPQIPSMFGIPNLIVGDFDNDGTNEVALVPWNNLYVLNIMTGVVERTGLFKPAANESGRGYGWLGAYDLTGDGREEFIVMGDFQDFITVLGWNGSGNLVQLWTHVFDPRLSGKQTAHRPGAFPVRDITGDGFPEIVTSVYNETGDQRWHLRVFNALTGASMYDLVDHVADAARDVNGDGDFELFVREAQGALLSETSTIKLLNWTGSAFVSTWSQTAAGFIQRDIADFPHHVNSATSTGKRDVLTGPISPGGRDLFFTRRPLSASESTFVVDSWQLDGTGSATRIGTATGTNVSALAVRSVGAGQPSMLFSTEVVGDATGSLAFVDLAGASVFSQLGSPPRSSAVVGRLSGPDSRPTVIVQGGSESIAAFEPRRGGRVTRSWTHSGIGGFTGATQFQGQHEYSGVALGDLNGDSQLETLYAATGEGGQARLVAVRPNGSELWHKDFDVPGGTRIWNQAGLTLWRTGHFRSLLHEDVLVQLMRGTGGTGEFQLLDGLTGATVWTRTYGNTPGSSPIQRNAGEAQIAVYDWDRDGLDEAVNFHPDMFYVVDGDGDNLVDRSVYNGGVFPGGSPLYGTPIVADFRNNQTDSILFAGSYAQLGLVTKNGNAVWNTPFTFDNTPGFIQGVGDVDGDGDLDLLSVAHPSAPGIDTQSRFHAYDAATGTRLWTVPLPGRAHAPVGGAYADTPTISVSGDIDNDGRVESVFAIGSTLYAVGADPNGSSGRIEWTFTPDNGLLGSPILADANGDGRAEIIVVSTSGFVYGIGRPRTVLSQPLPQAPFQGPARPNSDTHRTPTGTSVAEVLPLPTSRRDVGSNFDEPLRPLRMESTRLSTRFLNRIHGREIPTSSGIVGTRHTTLEQVELDAILDELFANRWETEQS